MLTLNLARLRRRWRCHGSLMCCQKIDRPMCNSWNDPHRLARRRYRRQRQHGIPTPHPPTVATRNGPPPR